MDDETRCWGCGQERPDDAPGGLCPACLIRAGFDGSGNYSHEMTVSFGPASSSTFSRLAESLGGLPRVLLRDADSPSDPGPIVRPALEEMPDVDDRSMRLQLFGEIARGGMGIVLKGRDPDLGRDVAVKVLLDAHRDNPDLIRRFVEEAQIGGQLQHPGIVPIYELGAFADRRPFFAMKLVKGRTLSSLLAERPDPARDLPRFLAIFESICQTMAYAHARGVIHRDLKPSNVMVGSFGEVQVMDWGLAKVLPRGGAADDAQAGMTRASETVIATARSAGDSDRSQAGSILGTPSYMAPEQARGETDRLDERCDVFALGSILCELLTGHPAFTGRSSGEILRKAARGEVSSALALLDACGADAELTTLAKLCLAPEPADRPAHAGEVSDRMRAYQAGVQDRLKQAEIARAQEAARAEEATKLARVERDRLRLTVALAASVFGLIAVGGGGWAYLARQLASRRAATERVVAAALDEATLLRGQASAAPVGDLSKWAIAKTAADRARAALEAGEASPALRTRVDQLVVGITREQSDAASRLAEFEKDRKLLDRLNEIRLDPVREADPLRIDADYRTAFREFGVDVDRLDPGDAGRALAKRSEPQEIAQFLDDWAFWRREQGHVDAHTWQRLLVVARATDRDPWRNGLRELTEGGDDQAVRRLASDRGALAAQPARNLYLLSRALEFCQKEQSGQASTEPIEILELAWRMNPGDYSICSQLGRICESTTDRIRFRTAAVAAKPADAWAHSFLGSVYADCSYDTIAYKWVTDPDRPAPYSVSLSRFHVHTHGSEERPLRLSKRGALSLKTRDGHVLSFGPALHLDCDAITAEDLARALAEYKEAVRLKPSQPRFRVECADVMVLQGDIKGALAEYREAARLSGSDDKLHEHIAQVFFVKGEFDLAIAEVQEQIRLHPRTPGPFFVHQLLGIIYQKQGNNRLAFAAYRDQLLEERSYVGVLHNFLRLALESTGTPEDVLKAYSDAVAICPQDSQLRRTLLEICLRLGMTPKVQAALEADVSRLRGPVGRDTNDPEVLRGFGAGLLALEHRTEAAAEFRKALEAMKKDPGKWLEDESLEGDWCNDVARSLATSSRANQRYGIIAVEFATRACELTGWKEVNYLDTLAAAHAEAGDFESAVRRQTEAISLLRDAKQKEDFGQRLKLYKDRKPFRDAK